MAYQAEASKNLLNLSDLSSGAVSYLIHYYGRSRRMDFSRNRAGMDTVFSSLSRMVEARSEFLNNLSPVQLQYLSAAAMSALIDNMRNKPTEEIVENAVISSGSNYLGDWLTTWILGSDKKLI